MARRTRAWQRGAAALTVGAVLLTSCWGGDDDDDDDGGSPAESTQPTTTTIAEPIVSVDGIEAAERVPVAQLGLRLSEGVPVQIADDVEVVDGDPLTEVELAAIFDRLTAWVVPASDRQDFARPAESLPPPLVGEPIETPFPPPDDGGSVDPPDADQLHVLRYQPEGPVDVAPFLSVTFDQPMVPLATLDQLDAADVPVRITPAIEGRWRWIGTRTLRFELVPGVLDRLPAATNYDVEIPEGTEAANGAILAEPVTWSFTTPTPTVTSFVGDSESLPLAPVFVAVFDQRVDPDAVLAVTTLTVGGEPWPVRLATPSEIAADEPADNAVGAALDSRAVAFRPVAELPADTDLKITIGPGTPSAEGPLTSPLIDTQRARTFGQLEVASTSCDWGSGCTPGVPFTIRFSNPLDPEAFSADQVSVSPPIPGLRINVYGDVIDLAGLTRGRTTYTVELSGDLEDIFGQTLGDDQSIEFDVGSAPPELRGLDREWITTDPTAEKPLVSVSTINHDSVHVIAWAVNPANLAEYRDYVERQWSDAEALAPEWQVVYDEVVEIDAEPDQWAETAIDLSSPFNQTGSQLVVRIEPTRVFSKTDDDYWRNRPSIAWIQKTTLGVDAFFDDENLVIWTTDLTTGKPVGGVPVELIGDGRIATTDEEGLAELELGNDGVLGLWANGGDRTAFLPSDWWEGWKASETSDESRWYIFDDRGIYRPGETARITGWVRRLARTEDAQLALYDSDVTVTYQAWDPQGNQIGSGTVDLNALGGFNLTIDVPEGSNLGPASIDFQLDGAESSAYGAGYHVFQVQEFRTPEFEVTARNESAGPHYTARPATVAVDADYYSGGPLPDAEVNWLVSTSTTTYSPPNWDTFTFGIWQPWWYTGGAAVYEDSYAAEAAVECFDCGPGYGATEYEQFSGRTDADGSHYLQIDFDGPDVDLPTSVTAEATVFDVNRQAWASRTSLLVHPAQYYIGLRSDRTFVERGQPLRIDAVVTDVDGALVGGRSVDIVAGRLEWVLDNGTWSEQVADQTTCTITSTENATDESMRCEFATDLGGTYRITAVVVDDSDHRNRSELTQWVTGGEGRPNRNVELESVNIVPDHETYAPGETAQLLVQAPFSPATGLVTVLRQGIESTFTFETEDGGAVVEIPIEDQQIPNLTVQIDMVGSAVRTTDDGTLLPDLPPRTAYATGQITLSIPPITRTLEVIATPAAKAVEPGDDTAVTIEVRGPDGQPVSGADVAIVVVDEAVLSLTGYQLIDPLNVFYQQVWGNLNAQYTRSSVQLTRSDLVTTQDGDDRDGAAPTATTSDDFAAEQPASESAADTDLPASGDESAGTIDLRSDFDALAVYAPEESTGADGTVRIDVPLPDNLTRYRVMAVAVDGADHFGMGESTITARLPLQARPSAPRLLNFGDRFELPIVLQNQTDQALEAEVALQVANLTIVGPAGKRVTVPPNDRIEVRFPVTTDEVGTARFRVVTVSGEFADAAEIELPVYTPATAEAFATYGVIDDGAVAQPLLAPTGVFPQFGGLEIGTSSTALQALTDAVLYLVEYRFDSADGYASRIMAVAALRDVLDAFDAGGLPDPAELDLQVSRDITKLAALQNEDGGFPYWQRGRLSIPWESIQSTHALVLAHDAGYLVPAQTLNSALEHLADIEQYFPTEYGTQIRNTLSAYALYVRSEAGDTDVIKATDLYRSVGDQLELDAVAWLWPSIIDADLREEIERRFANSAVETPNAATFATDYDEDAYLIAQSDRKTDGIVLDALITETPDSDLIVKVVNGLLGNQTRGRWNNAHENAFILLALNRYFDTFESITPDFVARVWLGDLYASEYSFLDRTTERATTLVPMSELVTVGDTNLIVQKDGEGRLYYRLGLRYAPSDLKLDARDEGFVVDRVYEGVDDAADVTRDANGIWHIRAGASVRVKLTMVADARRTHVALIDPLPAGLEPVNPALVVSQTTPPDESDVVSPDRWFWSWNWFEHQNLRDDRAEAFTSFLPGGTYEYTYIARATTPGDFVVPPARAEQIYAPEVFGRSSSANVVID
jgi:uncharacterized protein YfaS (alpha-2-macroglobulin family)